VTEKLVWHVVKEFAAKIGVIKLAPHDLRRYAECRIMPNRLIEVAMASSAAADDAA
jgi:hypothetical protein